MILRIYCEDPAHDSEKGTRLGILLIITKNINDYQEKVQSLQNM